MQEPQIVTIEQFLGVNKKSTETLLKPGEAADMSNFMITDDLKLQKMYGYIKQFATLTHGMNGMWYGSLSGTNHFLFSCNGHIYEHSLSAHTNTDLGALEDEHTEFWTKNNTVYIMDGDDMYSWSGSGAIASVAGYAPTVFTAADPEGGGTILESLNYLIGKKTQKYSARDSLTIYQLPEYGIESVDSVYVNGVLKTVTADYTVDLTAGTVTFAIAPTSGTNNVYITWTKTISGDRELITNCHYYGGIYYARSWLYGNANHKSTRYPSGITMNGVADPTYWPKYADSDVSEDEITGMCTQYDKQIIFTTGNEASAWYSYEETYLDDSTGIVTTIFPVKPINSKVGNVAKGQIQIIYNDPFTLWKGIYQWSSSNVVNEKNAGWISERVQNDLDAVDLSTAITADWSDKGLYLVCVGKKVWVLNYRVNAWYILDLAHTPTCFVVAESDLYFGTSDGLIMKFDSTEKTYDGTAIVATWRMGFYNFGADWIYKYIQKVFISITPRLTTHVDVSYMTDRVGLSDVQTVSYSLATFEHLNFATFSFKTNINPQPFKLKIKAKKIDYFALVLENDGADTVTVLSVTLPVFSWGEVRRR